MHKVYYRPANELYL